MDKLAYVLELIWLVLTFFCIGMGVYVTVKLGFSKMSYTFFILGALAFAMYFIRRRRRLK
ncbi:MAG: hypothetical protein AB7S54_00510 [Bacteroidales bacterium]